MVLLAKTLEQGVFRWPKVQDGAMRLTAVQLTTLLDGLDWTRVYSPRRTRAPVAGELTQSARGGRLKAPKTWCTPWRDGPGETLFQTTWIRSRRCSSPSAPGPTVWPRSSRNCSAIASAAGLRRSPSINSSWAWRTYSRPRRRMRRRRRRPIPPHARGRPSNVAPTVAPCRRTCPAWRWWSTSRACPARAARASCTASARVSLVAPLV